MCLLDPNMCYSSPKEPQNAVPGRMVTGMIVVADLQRKIERNEVGIRIGAGRSVRPMTQSYEGHFLPKR